ncbi:MAG: hypothetical protein IM638_04210 [Bacteroidetes bacterium]|nr:hypothetical protein [Bacteroidota bacterium]
MPVRFLLFLAVLFASCGVQSTADLLLTKPCGSDYTIDYNSTYGLRFIQDSIESTGPARQCSGSDYLAPHQRSNSFSIYRQCRATTRHSSGRCGKHR